jgi:hypothetical protein
VFINPVPTDKLRGEFSPILYVRFGDYSEFSIPKSIDTDTDAYHGGSIFDEIAALVSLTLGIRARAGYVTREFSDKHDPFGRPVERRRPPRILSVDYDRLVVPNAVVGKKSIQSIDLFGRIPFLKIDEANALIKAARAYQNALLVAESDPSLSWIFLVTSIERAAKGWASIKKTNMDIYRMMEPAFSSKLEEVGQVAFNLVARHYAGLVKNKFQFIEFLKAHLPDPPIDRPADWAQFDWRRENCEGAFGVIYKHRSKALHEGAPFPVRMCEAPPKTKIPSGKECWHERPVGEGASALGGTWSRSDLPMYLNTFEYIVRNCLLRWWQRLGLQKGEEAGGTP